MGTNKKELANKRRQDYVSMLAKTCNLRPYQKELLDIIVKKHYTQQQQINLLKPSRVRFIEQLLSE